MYIKKKFFAFVLTIFIMAPCFAAEEIIINENSVDIQAVETTKDSRYPDYAKMYLGEDKFENFNRKMFSLNTKLNKYVARPVHILWASIMPNFGMDRIRDAYNNIEYPKRLVSTILQRDGQAVRQETLRFLTNTTLGLGGLFDPADKIFKIKPTNENMEQALCKCKMRSGSYLVAPCLNSCTPRSLCGRALEAALDPSLYIISPITSVIKFGLMINRTSYMQPLAQIIESNYADPYDIHKKLFGLENYIRNSNFDRYDLLKVTNLEQIATNDSNDGFETGAAATIQNTLSLANSAISDITPDIILENYNSQSPVVDSMRTALFEKSDIYKSMWNEISLWNRSFARRIKKGSIKVTEGRDDYTFSYILQKNKNAPLIILYPSIGEGSDAHHSVVFAKMFYDEGYSVVMQGSHFHWEFAKSMKDGYAPGLPDRDSENIRLITSKIFEYLNQKYGCEFSEKYLIGTSFGALAALYVAEKESKNNILGINKFIAISPPIELKYALQQLDKNSDEYDKNSSDVKDKTAITAAKILQLLDIKNENKEITLGMLPFSDEEGKLITTFILRQKLSDLIYAIENIPQNKKTDFYERINDMSYGDYAEKYLGVNVTGEDAIADTSLFSLKDYLLNNDNYQIYHSLDDYFTNSIQLNKLRNISGKHLICLNCGAHLGFLYRKEFETHLMNTIKSAGSG